MKALYRALVAFIAVLIALQSAKGQDECGAACPVCTGDLKTAQAKEKRYSGVVPHGRVSWFNIVVLGEKHGDEEERGSTSFTIGLFNRMDAGLTLGLESWDVRGRVKVLLTGERIWWPAVLAGIGNIRPSGLETNGYLMFSKAFPIATNFPIHAYVGVARPFDNGDFEGIAGLSMGIGSNVGGMSAYDGKEFHIGGAYQVLSNVNLGVLLLEARHPALISNVSAQVPYLKPRN
jgi:hypothetical protein